MRKRSRNKFKNKIRSREKKITYTYKKIEIQNKNPKIEKKEEEKFPYYSIQGFFKKENIQDVNNQLKNILISGLLSFNVLYNPVCNKIIYLMGEQHNFENICTENSITANEFFFKIINANNGNKLDIFFESIYEPFNPKCIRIQQQREYCQSFMSSVMLKLGMENCLSTLHEGCKYYKDYIRFHSVDVRSFDLTFFRYFSLIRNIQLSRQLELAEPLIDELRQTREFSQIFSNATEFLQMFGKIITLTKIDKQLQYINPNIRHLLIDEQSKIIPDQFEIFNYNNVLNFCNSYYNAKLIMGRSPTITEMIKINGQILTTEIKIDSLLMDVYNIARIFRKFSHPSTINTNLQSFPTDPSNIIIYAGNYHIQFYNNIFTKMGFINIFKGDQTDKISCIKLNNFKIKWICNKITDNTCLLPLLRSNITQWTVNDVLQWLIYIDKKVSIVPQTIMKIEQIIDDNNIDGQKLLLIKDSDELLRLGIVMGPAIKLFNEIQTLKYYYS